ncbi:MAG: PIG-L deacetylase family protein [Pseudonocardiaceae bacterium]
MSPAGSVLTVMAHPDDAELWAGGTLAIHAQAGAPVTIAVPRTKEVRDREAAVGAKALGAALRLLDELTTDTLHGLLTELRPEVVITHNADDIHPDHQRAAQTLLTAVPKVVIATGHPRRVYTCDGYQAAMTTRSAVRSVR